jgi:hypothetical protein
VLVEEAVGAAIEPLPLPAADRAAHRLARRVPHLQPQVLVARARPVNVPSATIPSTRMTDLPGRQRALVTVSGCAVQQSGSSASIAVVVLAIAAVLALARRHARGGLVVGGIGVAVPELPRALPVVFRLFGLNARKMSFLRLRRLTVS